MEGYKTVYLCHLDFYTMTVCTRYLVSSHVVPAQLPTTCRCLVDRYLHRPHGSGYQDNMRVLGSHCLVVMVSGTREQ